jgi:hypothetical protein
MTRAELLSRISAKELRDWEIFAAVEPFGEERADIRSATICCILANINRDPKKTSAFEIKDFLPKFDPPEPMTPDEIKAHLLNIGGA